MEITIIIPQAKEQRVLDSYEVDNEADLKAKIIRTIKRRVEETEYEIAKEEIKDNFVSFDL